MRLLLLLSPAFFLAPLYAQVPSTDILLLERPTQQAQASEMRALNITNRAGYDNQPFFSPDGWRLYYTSIREDGQADIYYFDLSSGATHRFTATPESEFSPTVTPTGGLSVVRVEADSTQRLWAFDADGQSPTLLLEHRAPVGYHAWADPHTVALFVLGEPPTLQLADLRTGTADTLARDIGRALHPVPGRHAISFLHKETPDRWIIKVLDLGTRTVTPVVEALPGREDYAWMPDGHLLMGRDTALYTWSPEQQDWKKLADFSTAGITNITRIAVSPDGRRIALVVERA